MNSQPVEFEVAPAALEYGVWVRLQKTAGRWLAITQCLGTRHLGLGATARDALAAAFGPLGPRTAAILMADPALFGASLHVARRQAAGTWQGFARPSE